MTTVATAHRFLYAFTLALYGVATAAAQNPAESGEGLSPGHFGFGRTAEASEIDTWDIEVSPSGEGLPEGSGTAATGAPVFARQCAACHGPNGDGGTAAALVGLVPGGGPPFGRAYETWRGDRDHVPYTVGNYWPYATTLFDYINRAMPTGAPGSLAPDQVYGLVAWLLFRNEIIEEEAVMNRQSVPLVAMPARDIFVPDDRRGGPEGK